MIRQNLHTHTVFDDGKNTVSEMAQAALDAGLASLGFSGHSVLPYDNDWAMTEESSTACLAAVSEAQKAFAGRLAIFCGLEWDILSPAPAGFDYIIGSIHHLPVPGGLVSVDEAPEVTKAALARYFGNDPDAFAAAYFAQYDALAKTEAVDIVGHFDLLTKFDEKHAIFRPDSPRFCDAAMAALESLCRADKIFEVNTGAISRGWRTAPYPSAYFLRELRARNARVCVTSDAHSTDAIACAFPEAEALLCSLGFRETWELTENGFTPVRL